MDLRKYGPPPPPCVLSPTHLGGSEGCYSLGFTSARGVTIHFRFTHQTERLYKVVVEWAGKRSRSVRAQSDQLTVKGDSEMKEQEFSVLHESNPQDHYVGSLYEGCGSLSPL
jgi:hypothetical protein